MNVKRIGLFVLLVSLVTGVVLAQSQTNYALGGRGPGGGTIFHIGRHLGPLRFRGDFVYECSRDLGEYNWHDAVNVARNYGGGGFSDWRLPNIQELQMINTNNRIVTHNWQPLLRPNTGYWSSTEIDSDFSRELERLGYEKNPLAYSIFTGNSNDFESIKSETPSNVVAVRSFQIQ